MLEGPEGLNLNMKSPKDGTTCLHYASLICNPELVEKLITNGADPKIMDALGLASRHTIAPLQNISLSLTYTQTPLHWATYAKRATLVKQLLKSGASPNATSTPNAGYSFLFFLFISLFVCPSFLSLTKDHLSFCRDQNMQGVSVLHLAAFFGSLPIVQILVEAGAQVPAQDSTFSTQPLHWAAMGGHTPIVEYLLDTGAPQLAQTEKGIPLSRSLSYSPSLPPSPLALAHLRSYIKDGQRCTLHAIWAI